MVCLLSAVLLVGCAQKEASEQAEEGIPTIAVEDHHSDDGVLRVGISMPSSSLERWNHDGEFLKKHLESEGYEVELTFSDNLIDTQIDNIDRLIEDQSDVLIIAAVDGKALSRVMETAAGNNIPVISYDRLICDTPFVTAYVSYDNYRVGQLQGEYLRDALNLDHPYDQTYHIELVSGDSADNNAAYFYNGAYDVLKPYIDSGVVQVLSGQKDFYTTSTDQWSGENARSRMEILLGAYYSSSVTLHGVLCANDSTASGVMEALERDYHMDNSVVITGQDCDVSNLDAIMEGKQSMSVYKDLNREAQTAVELTKAILNGESVNASLVERMEYPCRYDTSQYNNGIISVPSFLLEPETVTADNAMDILVEKYGSYTYGELGFQRVME